MPVAPASTPDLIDLIRRSGIARDLPAPDALPDDAQKAAGVLIQKGVITRFQAQQLLLGRHKGFRLGAYVILEQLGRGGMGVVYLAEHQELRRKVAIKVLVVNRDEDAKLAAERFFREARAAAALDHPNIVRIFDVCRHGDTPYLVMEYVDGETLQQALDRDGAMPYTAAADAVAQAAAGLQHAHEKGFVHRDIKPGNLMRDRTGVVKILDMGLARSATAAEDKLTERLDAGAVVGTADFIAPEQALNSPNVDIRADIYSLGATFFALVTGKPPFAGNTTQKLLQHQMAAPPSVSTIDSSFPLGLAGVVAKMLAKKPQDRFSTPGEVIAALAPWLGNSPRVMAGLSRTNLAAGAELHARLQDRAASSGRLRRPAEDAVSDSGVVRTADPAAETGAVASSRTARSEQPVLPAVVAGLKTRPLLPIAAGVVAVAASLTGVAFALGAFDSKPAAEQVHTPPPPAPAAPVEPPKPRPAPPPVAKAEPPKPAPATTPKPTPAAEPVLARFTFAGQAPFAVRCDLDVRPDGNKVSRPVSRTGPGQPPTGWTARCWNKDTQMEYFADGTDSVGIRNVRGPGSAMLFAPSVAVPGGLCRVRVEYSANAKAGQFSLRFKPADGRGAWDAFKPQPTGPAWQTAEFVHDLKGATAGYFEFHVNDANPDAAFRIRSVTISAPPAGTPPTPVGNGATAAPPPPVFAGWPEGAVVYRFDAAAVPAFRVTKEGGTVTSGEGEKLPRGVSARCWKKEAFGEFRRDEADGSAALGVTNLSDAKSGQVSFELERSMGLTLKPGAYRVKVSYLLRNEATGAVVVQTTDYKGVASTKLDGPAGGWKSAVVNFERKADAPVRLTIDNHAVGEGNIVYVRSVELVELVPPR